MCHLSLPFWYICFVKRTPLPGLLVTHVHSLVAAGERTETRENVLFRAPFSLDSREKRRSETRNTEPKSTVKLVPPVRPRPFTLCQGQLVSAKGNATKDEANGVGTVTEASVFCQDGTEMEMP